MKESSLIWIVTGGSGSGKTVICRIHIMLDRCTRLSTFEGLFRL
jgi:ABC-type transporter Mla maintaining outer membrane lipid asymmetry ATPase subunit MlaF